MDVELIKLCVCDVQLTQCNLKKYVMLGVMFVTVCICFLEALTEEEKEKLAKIKKKMKRKVRSCAGLKY